DPVASEDCCHGVRAGARHRGAADAEPAPLRRGARASRPAEGFAQDPPARGSPDRRTRSRGGVLRAAPWTSPLRDRPGPPLLRERRAGDVPAPRRFRNHGLGPVRRPARREYLAEVRSAIRRGGTTLAVW